MMLRGMGDCELSMMLHVGHHQGHYTDEHNVNGADNTSPLPPLHTQLPCSKAYGHGRE